MHARDLGIELVIGRCCDLSNVSAYMSLRGWGGMSDIRRDEIFVGSSKPSMTRGICKKIIGGEGGDWQLIGFINIYTTIHHLHLPCNQKYVNCHVIIFERLDNMSNIGTHISIINIDDRRNEVTLLPSLSMIEGISEGFQLNQIGLRLTFVMDQNTLHSSVTQLHLY